MIPDDVVQKLGGDWAGLGEASLKELIEQDRVKVMFTLKAVLVSVRRTDEAWGTYNLAHKDIADF